MARKQEDRQPVGWLLEYETPRKMWKPCLPVIAYDSAQAQSAAAEALHEQGVKKWTGFRVKKVIYPTPRKLGFNKLKLVK